MYGDFFANSEWDGARKTIVIFTLRLSHGYGRPSKWIIWEELVIFPNQSFGRVDDNIIHKVTSHPWWVSGKR